MNDSVNTTQSFQMMMGRQQSRSFSLDAVSGGINVIGDYCQQAKQRKESVDDFEQTSYIKMIQIEISDFVVLETCHEDLSVLSKEEWRRVIENGNFNGVSQMRILASLFSQNLEFLQRRSLWHIFCGMDDLKQRYSGENGYEQLRRRRKQCKYLEQIQKDVERTIKMSDVRTEQPEYCESLTDILVAYANFDSELGYSQGMSIIAINLLYCYDLSKNEDNLDDYFVIDNQRDQNVFYLFVYIMVNQKWRTLFMDHFPGLFIMLRNLETLIKQHIPDLHYHFHQQGLDNLMILFQESYQTMLMYNMPWKHTRIILDLFLKEGESIMHRLIIAMLKFSKEKLKRKTYCEIIRYCKDHIIRDFFALFDSFKTTNQLVNTLSSLGLIQMQTIHQQKQPTQQQQQQQQQQYQIETKQKKSFTNKLKHYFSKQR